MHKHKRPANHLQQNTHPPSSFRLILTVTGPHHAKLIVSFSCLNKTLCVSCEGAAVSQFETIWGGGWFRVKVMCGSSKSHLTLGLYHPVSSNNLVNPSLTLPAYKHIQPHWNRRDRLSPFSVSFTLDKCPVFLVFSLSWLDALRVCCTCRKTRELIGQFSCN